MQKQDSHKVALIIGGVAMLSLLAMSAILYVERTTFIDNPFQLFLMIQDQRIEVMAGRYPSVIVRWLPYWVMKAGGSLGHIMFAFSMAYTLFFALIYYLIAYRLHLPWMALLIPSMLILGNTEGFYWCNSELFQGAAMAVLTIAIYRASMSTLERVILAGICMIVALLMHPLSVVLIVFYLAYEFQSKYIDSSLVGLIVFAIISYVAKTIFWPNWYDTAKRSQFNGYWDQYKDRLWELPSLHNFVQSSHGIIILLLLAISVIVLFRTKSWMRLVWLLGVFMFYLIMVSISDPMAQFSFYTEVNRTPLLLIAIWPIVYYVRSSNDTRSVILWAALLVFGVVTIVLQASYHQERRAYYIDVLSDRMQDRYHLSVDLAPMDLIQMEWASPYESLIISAHTGAAKTLLIYGDSTLLDPDKDVDFIGTFNTYENLNENYFDLDSEAYQALPID